MSSAKKPDAAAAGAESKKEQKGDTEVKEPRKIPHAQQAVVNELVRNVRLLEGAVKSRDTLLLHRALRYNTHIRRTIRLSTLERALSAFLPESSTFRADLLALVSPMADHAPDTPMLLRRSSSRASVTVEEDREEVEVQPLDTSAFKASQVPEVEVYMVVLTIGVLVREDKLSSLQPLLVRAFEHVQAANRRTMDALAGRVYHFLGLAYERAGRLAALRPVLAAAHSAATLRHNTVGQAILLNLQLRLLLEERQYEQALKLISKTAFPEDAPYSQLARYMYYCGRVQAVQLDYSAAHRSLLQALRKAPQHAAAGFRIKVHRLAIVVQLLMGEMPDRAAVSQPSTQRALAPYLRLARAVHAGDLAQFEAALAAGREVFERDATSALVGRLRQNVIKTGLRRLSLSYSRIAFADVAAKLGLASAEDAEAMAAKAVRDGVIEARLDHEEGCMRSKTRVDVYGSTEPLEALHRRIEFCMDVRNEAVRAMRYPDKGAGEKETAAAEPEESAEAIVEQLMEEDGEDDGED